MERWKNNGWEWRDFGVHIEEGSDLSNSMMSLKVLLQQARPFKTNWVFCYGIMMLKLDLQ